MGILLWPISKKFFNGSLGGTIRRLAMKDHGYDAYCLFDDLSFSVLTWKWAWPPLWPKMFRSLNHGLKSWPTEMIFWVDCYLEIMLPKLSGPKLKAC